MCYANSYIRGVPNDDFITPDGRISSHLFYFYPRDERTDGWLEQSINWLDNKQVIEFTLNQKNNKDEIKFKSGIVKLPRNEIDRLNQQPTIKGLLSYERCPIINNPYHGNLLLKNNTAKPTMKMIAAGLALTITAHIKNNL